MAGKKTHRKVIAIGATAAIIMFAFCFAVVPFYSLICRATGINTSVPNSGLLTPVSAKTTEPPDLTRTINVQFVAVNHNGMPWEFYPLTKTVKVHPGENKEVLFYAKNTTGKTMSVQAVPSITPPESISHFHKIECFCFTQQTLNAQQSKEMPMKFRIDKQIPPEVSVITLAYTLYDTTQQTRKG